ncbi:hypothetical protein H4Q26_016222 [Puccinia striiformis f. sp. tritici PST-130]|nr:hypothetical protein H4Q26_016222 [Puccinia striiformis f. sp. tritici PST-130]
MLHWFASLPPSPQRSSLGLVHLVAYGASNNHISFRVAFIGFGQQQQFKVLGTVWVLFSKWGEKIIQLGEITSNDWTMMNAKLEL